MPEQFKIMGFPRGGTHFISSLLDRYGFTVGHEEIKRYGICDWRTCLDGKQIPENCSHHLGPSRNIGDPDFRLLVIRNPFHVISTWSQMYTGHLNDEKNSVHGVIQFVGNLVEKEFEYNNLIERSLDTYLKWYKINIDTKPERIIKVENSIKEIGDFLIEKKMIVRHQDINMNNSHMAKTNFSSERINKEEILNSINATLKERLKIFCEEYSYNKEFK